MTFDEIAAEFLEALNLESLPDAPKLQHAAEQFLSKLGNTAPVAPAERRVRLTSLVNTKFELNKDGLALLYAQCAKEGVTFNYQEKLRLALAFNRNDKQLFKGIVSRKGHPKRAIQLLFRPVSRSETIERLHRELKSPTLVRKDSKPRDWCNEIIQSLFGGFVFSSFPIEAAHGAFELIPASLPYEPNFWRFLHKEKGGGLSRAKSLTYLRLSPDISIDEIAAGVAHEFGTLSNHGHLAIHFADWGQDATRAAGLLTVFAEKFFRTKLKGAFFRPQEIERTTRAYVPLEASKDYGFESADLGFHYRDTFVFANGDANDLLLIFQKNVADESLVACPACRSTNVQGNSYSSLGVKSWECKNPICPDRSKFNRGKRYSFLQLLKQEAIELEENQIPRKSVRAWARDVQPTNMIADILPMLVKHYSLAEDGVLIVGSDGPVCPHRQATRMTTSDYFRSIPKLSSTSNHLGSLFLARYAVELPVQAERPQRTVQVGNTVAMEGDSTALLYGFEGSTFDGAVTSPPYYNAREYSSWDNIYCYLYDMFSNARAVFRVLKPGGYYLFNIFDYFDNEKTIASSAMGQKRMILSAYCIQLFEQSGFRCVGNVAWDKGEIEGKRGFNGGNFSPYYQSPFNCWEHVLVFRKPGAEVKLTRDLPTILRAKPVIKMVRGENRHGHTAPYPEAIPRLLLDRLPHSAKVLDPYGGSMTTGVAANKTGHEAVCIEQSAAYFDLAVDKLHDATSEQMLA